MEEARVALVALVIAGVLAACGSSSSEDATPLHPATNGMIVYEDDGMQTWILNPNGSGRHRLLKLGDEPAFSPEGKQIVYVYGVLDPAVDNYVPRLWVMNADGSKKRRIPIDVNPSETDAHPDWSPDGKTIIFAGAPPGDVDHINIYSVKPDGSALKQLTTGLDGSPSWSPDGKKIAFTRLDEDEPTAFDIYAMNADGSDEHKLVAGMGPDWSPDGKKIAFWGLGEIDVVNADGSGTHKLIELAAFPAWSPDGKKIAYGAGEVGERSNGLYVMNADGSDGRQLVHTGFSSVRAVSWQPRRQGE